MKCAWQAYLNLLPHKIRPDVDRQGKENLQELRLRIGQRPEMMFQGSSYFLQHVTTKEDITFVINAASEYSPWTAGTVSQGFLTAQGGHRIGICGVSTIVNGKMNGISMPSSLCIRVARDYTDISQPAAKITGSILIIGPPGSGKTTLLRDLIRNKSNLGQGSVAVVDEREELFPLFQGQAMKKGM